MSVQTNASDIHLSFTAPGPLVARTSPMSIGAWLNSASWNNVGDPVSILDFVLEGTTGFQLGTRGSNSIDVWVWGGAITVSTGVLFAPVVNTWTHVMYTYDGTTHSLYVNGVLIVTSTTVVVAGNLNQIYINGFPTGGVSETNTTLVEDFVLYSRCLTAGEVKHLTATSLNSGGLYHGLVAAYRMEGAAIGSSVTVAVDQTSNHYDLTVEGASGTPLTLNYGPPALVAVQYPQT